MKLPTGVGTRRLLVALEALLLAPTAAFAQDSASPAPAPRVARARVVSAPPVVDGRLNDAAWRDAAPLAGFVQRELREGDPVSGRTEVRVVANGEAL